MEAFGSSCRTTTCERRRPFPRAVRTNEAEPISTSDARRIRIVTAATPIPSVIAGRSVDLTLFSGSRWNDTYPWVGRTSSSTPIVMISAIPITNVGIAIPIAANAERTALR